MVLDALVGAPGCKTLISKNARPNGIQKLLALMSSLASSAVLAEADKRSPVSGKRGGSMTTSLQTCDKRVAVVSLKELCRNDTNPPRLHIKQWLILFG